MAVRFAFYFFNQEQQTKSTLKKFSTDAKCGNGGKDTIVR